MLAAQFRVILAIMLRNIRTRFFGHGLGFMVAIGWPFIHISLLLILHSWAERAAPYGESLILFFATGLAPLMAFLYISRFTMTSVQNTRPLLSFPVVKITDLLFAGAILEVLSSCCSLLVLVIALEAIGISSIPLYPVQAAFALGTAMLLGIGWGIVNSLIAMAAPTWMTVNSLITIFLYATSGIFFLPSALPHTIRYILSFNPVLQVVEWMRSAYFDGYESILDKPYALGCAVMLVFIGLAVERIFRGRYLILG